MAVQPAGAGAPNRWCCNTCRWALAELNITLAAWTHLFHEQRLLESHNFTRCPKALAFEKLCFARGCADVPSVQQHPHLQAVSLVLDTALAGCSEAAISQVGACGASQERAGQGLWEGSVLHGSNHRLLGSRPQPPPPASNYPPVCGR